MNDWQARINHLRGSGLSMASIARSIGLSITALWDLKTGRSSEPRGMCAVKLHALAKSHGYGRKAA